MRVITARAGTHTRQGETVSRRERAAFAASQRQEDEAANILLSVGGLGAVPAVAEGPAYQDRSLESEAEAEPPYWATWSLV